MGKDGSSGGEVNIVTEELEAVASKTQNYLSMICQLGATITTNAATVTDKNGGVKGAYSNLSDSLKSELKGSIIDTISINKIELEVEGIDDFVNSYSAFATEVVTSLLELGESLEVVDPENGSVFDSILSFLNSSNAAWIIAAIGTSIYTYKGKIGSNDAYDALYRRIFGYIEKGANSAGYYADGHAGDGFYRNGNWAVKLKHLIVELSGNSNSKLANLADLGVGTVGAGVITAILYMYGDYIEDGSFNDLLGAAFQGATAAACYCTWGAITGAFAAIGGPMALVGTLVAIGATWVISTVGSAAKKYFTGNYEIGNTGIYKNGTGKETWDYYTKKYRHDDFLWDMLTGNEQDRWYVDDFAGVTPKTYKNMMYSDWRNVVDESNYTFVKDDLDSVYERIKNASSYEEAKQIFDEICESDSVIRTIMYDELPFDLEEYYYYTHQEEYNNLIKSAQEAAGSEVPTQDDSASKEALKTYNSDLSSFDDALDTFLEEDSSTGNMGIDAFESNVKKVNQLASTINSNEHYNDDQGIMTFEQFLSLRGFDTDYRKLYEDNPVHAEYIFRKYCEAMENNVENTQVEIA